MNPLLDIDSPLQAVTVAEAANKTGRSKQAVKKWIQRGLITPILTDADGHLLDWRDVVDIDRDTRHRRAGGVSRNNVPSISSGILLPESQKPPRLR